MGIKYGRGWGGARISLSRGSRENFPSSFVLVSGARQKIETGIKVGVWNVVADYLTVSYRLYEAFCSL